MSSIAPLVPRRTSSRLIPLLGLAAVGALLSPPVARATTSASVSVFASYDPPSEPLAQASDSDSGPNAASAAVGVGPSVADAASFADHGVLRAYALNALDNGAVSVAHASARASWQDQITLSSPGLDGRTARVTLEFDLDGYLDPTGGAEAILSFVMEFAHPSFLRTVRQSITVAYGGSQESALAPPRIQTGLQSGEFVFQPGDPLFVTVLRTVELEFPVGTALGVSARLEANTNRDLQGTFGPGSAEVNFFNTSTWQGVKSVSVRDPVSGLFVPLSAGEFSFASAGGVDYRSAIVPEPGSALLLALGLTATAAAVRRGRSAIGR